MGPDDRQARLARGIARMVAERNANQKPKEASEREAGRPVSGPTPLPGGASSSLPAQPLAWDELMDKIERREPLADAEMLQPCHWLRDAVIEVEVSTEWWPYVDEPAWPPLTMQRVYGRPEGEDT